MGDDLETLTPAAHRRMAAALPVLLGEVRARRRRRRAYRAAVAALLLLAPIVFGWALAEPPAPAPPAPGAVSGSMPTWVEVATDTTVLERCLVPTTLRPEWFVDDAGLRELLLAAARPAGLVRAGDRVLVDPAAVDPWPGDAP